MDEYYYVYPDGSGIRKVIWNKGTLGPAVQFQESLPILQPGQLKSDLLEQDYVTIGDYDFNHLIALRVNEATKVLAEGVAANPQEVDLAMANGGGTPFGPFTLALSIGYPALTAKMEDLYSRFKLEVFKPTDMMKKGNIKV